MSCRWITGETWQSAFLPRGVCFPWSGFLAVSWRLGFTISRPADAFWQIPLNEESKDKKCLQNAKATTLSLRDYVIKPRRAWWKKSSLFTCITKHSCTWMIRFPKMPIEAFDPIVQSGSFRKSEFVMKEVRYLGHIVGNWTLCTNPAKASAISDFPRPKTIKQSNNCGSSSECMASIGAFRCADYTTERHVSEKYFLAFLCLWYF